MKLTYLDECGFAPSQPTAYSWALPGERKRVAFESTCGRRVNAMAAFSPFERDWRFTAQPRSFSSADFIAFLKGLPHSRLPRVIVVDNANLHRSLDVKRALPGLRRRRVHVFFLPAYSPELNLIEAELRCVKYEGLPVRAFGTVELLLDGVVAAFSDHAVSIKSRTAHQPGSGA